MMNEYNDTQYENNEYNAAYKGSKSFKQQQVPTANATGFGAATDDYADKGLDLNEHFIKNKPATFFFKMNGDAMIGAGIFNGDTLIVDRSIKNVEGRIIIAVINGDMLVRRLQKTINKIRLLPENNKIAIIEIDSFTTFMVWGVVVYTIHATP